MPLLGSPLAWFDSVFWPSVKELVSEVCVTVHNEMRKDCEQRSATWFIHMPLEYLREYPYKHGVEENSLLLKITDTNKKNHFSMYLYFALWVINKNLNRHKPVGPNLQRNPISLFRVWYPCSGKSIYSISWRRNIFKIMFLCSFHVSILLWRWF